MYRGADLVSDYNSYYDNQNKIVQSKSLLGVGVSKLTPRLKNG